MSWKRTTVNFIRWIAIPVMFFSGAQAQHGDDDPIVIIGGSLHIVAGPQHLFDRMDAHKAVHQAPGKHLSSVQILAAGNQASAVKNRRFRLPPKQNGAKSAPVTIAMTYCSAASPNVCDDLKFVFTPGSEANLTLTNTHKDRAIGDLIHRQAFVSLDPIPGGVLKNVKVNSTQYECPNGKCMVFIYLRK